MNGNCGIVSTETEKKYLHRDRDALAADRERRSRGLPFRATLLAALRAATYEIHYNSILFLWEKLSFHLQRDRDPDAERERRSRGLRLLALRERDLKENIFI